MNDIFRERLRQLRERQHKSRLTISELCGLPPDAVRRYERGESDPGMESLVKLADYFGVTLDYLTGRDYNKFPLKGDFFPENMR